MKQNLLTQVLSIIWQRKIFTKDAMIKDQLFRSSRLTRAHALAGSPMSHGLPPASSRLMQAPNYLTSQRNESFLAKIKAKLLIAIQNRGLASEKLTCLHQWSQQTKWSAYHTRKKRIKSQFRLLWLRITNITTCLLIQPTKP